MALGAMTVGDLVAYMRVDDSDFNKKTDAAEKRFGKLGGVLKAAGVAAGTAALAGLGKIMQTGIQESMDASAAQAQLAAGIKSTGGAAGVTVGHLNKLASEIQNYSGQTDDSIAQTEALLLTFTKIRNAGPDKIFDQATKAAADMAAKMGTDAPSAAIQLGKALNDPVKGVTALTRVGVQFTDAQKAQIKALVDSGDTMAAQKIILKELNTEFGGAARAAGESLPGQVEKAKRSFEDMSQSLVASLLPMLSQTIGFATKLVQGFDRLPGPMKAGAIATVALAAAIGVLTPLVGTLVGAYRLLFVAKVQDGIVTRAGIVQYTILRAKMIAQAVASKAVAAAQWLVNAAMSANPIGLIIAAIVGLVAALVIAYKKSETFRRIVNAAWDGVKKAAVAVFDFLVGFFKKWVGRVRSALSAISGVVSAVVGFFGRMKSGVASAFEAVVSFARSIPGRIKSAVGNLGKLLYSAGKSVATGLWNGIKSMAGWLWDKVTGWAHGIYDAVKKGLGKLWPFSPSQAGVDIGYYLGLGIEKGIAQGLPRVKAATATLSRELSLSPDGAAGMGFAGAGGGVIVNVGGVHVTVDGSGLSAPELSTAVRGGVEPALVALAREIARR